jgi:hypothetical protein
MKVAPGAAFGVIDWPSGKTSCARADAEAPDNRPAKNNDLQALRLGFKFAAPPSSGGPRHEDPRLTGTLAPIYHETRARWLMRGAYAETCIENFRRHAVQVRKLVRDQQGRVQLANTVQRV